MIFVTVGTENFQFNRLIKTIDELAGANKFSDPVFAQIGCATYNPKNIEYCDYLSYNEMVRTIIKANIIITHAGIGSTLVCLHHGKIPILLPRRFSNQEHLDDHQLEFAKHITTMNRVIVAFDESELLGKIEQYSILAKDLQTNKSQNKSKLIDYLNSICQ